MNHFREKRIIKAVAGVLSLAIFGTLALPSGLNADVCSKALVRCVIDAGLSAFLGLVGGLAAGNLPGALIGTAAVGGTALTFCLLGYDFCIRYFK